MAENPLMLKLFYIVDMESFYYILCGAINGIIQLLMTNTK